MKEICRITGYKEGTVRNYRGKPKVKKDYLEEIAKRFEEGANEKEIALEIGQSASTVRRKLIQMNLKQVKKIQKAQSEIFIQKRIANEKPLVAKEPPKEEKVTINGKTYKDVTAVYAGW